MEEGLTTIEILGVAVKREVDASLFYTNMAKRINNEIVKERIVHLAMEEKRHEALLRNIYKDKSGEERVPLPPGDSGFPDSAKMEKMSMEKLLGLAIEKEIESEKLYRIASDKAEDTNTASMLTYLSEMEKQHRSVLELEMKNLKNNSDWFEKDLGTNIQLEGP